MRRRIKKIYEEHKTTFIRTNITAFSATIVDFSTLYVLVEWLHVYYVWATAIGSFLGAVTNFVLNRIWAFQNQSRHQLHWQFVKYAVVSGIGLLLITGGVYVVTEYGHIPYMGSKLFVAALVGWFWNYPAHKYYVFAE